MIDCTGLSDSEVMDALAGRLWDALRRRPDLKAIALARAVGLDPASLSRIRNGQKPLEPSLLLKLILATSGDDGLGWLEPGTLHLQGSVVRRLRSDEQIALQLIEAVGGTVAASGLLLQQTPPPVSREPSAADGDPEAADAPLGDGAADPPPTASSADTDPTVPTTAGAATERPRPTRNRLGQFGRPDAPDPGSPQPRNASGRFVRPEPTPPEDEPSAEPSTEPERPPADPTPRPPTALPGRVSSVRPAPAGKRGRIARRPRRPKS